jgi:hypothetical protein
MTVAAPVPPAPQTDNASKRIVWAWRFDTDPNAFPQGYPLPPGQASPFDLFAAVEWDGGAFTAQLVDRRPLLVGGEAVITPITPVIVGTELQVTLNIGSLGLPSQFRWRASTNCFQTHEESMGQFPVDTSAFTTLVRTP